LARWVEEMPPPAVLTRQTSGACLREFALRHVFARDLVAAQGDGLLTLTGLEAPLELAGCVLIPPQRPSPTGIIEALEEARGVAGDVVAIDGPEYTPAAGFARELGIGLRATGLRAVVNLNLATPPSWADDLAEGPLFAGQCRPPDLARRAALSDALADECLALGPSRVRVDWHLGERDFAPEGEGRLLGLARRAADGAPLAFVFDRPRRPTAFGEGLDRIHPAMLLTVGLHLPRLIEQIGPSAEPAVFVRKLGSLARLALSAAVQKRDFLRRHSHGRPALARVFLLERARLVVVPVGLEAAVQTLAGRGLGAGGPGLELAREIVLRFRDVLQRDGQACRLEACLDSAAEFTIHDRADAAAPALASVAGLTPWDASAPIKGQLRAAGALHGTAGGGSMALLTPDRPPSAEDLVALLRYAWQQTDVVRLILPRLPNPHIANPLFPDM
jgi:hypothetical protein